MSEITDQSWAKRLVDSWHADKRRELLEHARRVEKKYLTGPLATECRRYAEALRRAAEAMNP